ncbi:MAG: S8 family serine peptidase [Fimbriimonadaceae bacterium]
MPVAALAVSAFAFGQVQFGTNPATHPWSNDRTASRNIVPFVIPKGARYVPDQVVVRPHDHMALPARSALVAVGGTIVDRLRKDEVFLVRLRPGSNVPMVLGQLAASGAFRYVEPNYIYEKALVPNDPLYNQQYHHQIIGSEAGWAIGTGRPPTGRPVAIAIVDDGVLTSHPDLTAKIVPGYDFVDNDADPNPGNPADDHGTFCAGLAAASTDNGVGIAGVSWGADIMPVRVLSGLFGSTFVIAQGIDFAWENGAKVINLSLGGPAPSSVVRSANQRALAAGAVIVAGAGNDNSNAPFYPAADPETIAVGSTDETDAKSDFSNFGSWVDVAAPGTAVRSTTTGDSYTVGDGTSFATPIVAGLAALLASHHNDPTEANIRNIIQSTTDDVGTWLNYGRINVGRAMSQLPVATSYAPVSMTAVGSFSLGTAADLAAIDSAYVSIGSRATGLGQHAELFTDFNIGALGDIRGIRLLVTARGIRGSSLLVFVNDKSLAEESPVFIRSFALRPTDQTFEVRLPAPLSRWVSPGGNVDVVVRALAPARLGSSFTFQCNHQELIVSRIPGP